VLFAGDESDEEIDRSFSMATALGADILTASRTPEIARRVARAGG
jgi:hypothetical protein